MNFVSSIRVLNSLLYSCPGNVGGEREREREREMRERDERERERECVCMWQNKKKKKKARPLLVLLLGLFWDILSRPRKEISIITINQKNVFFFFNYTLL